MQRIAAERHNQRLLLPAREGFWQSVLRYSSAPQQKRDPLEAAAESFDTF
jgi:hypothetical protein